MSKKTAGQQFSQAIRNPFFVFAIAVILSIAFAYVAKTKEAYLGKVWADVFNTVGTAILTSGTFGLWFDYFGKRKLISEVVRDAIGQTKCLSAGITDFQIKVVDIDERDDFRFSNTMIVGTRRSSGVLDRYKDEIRSRLRSGKNLVVIMQKDATMFRTAKNFASTPVDFLEELESSEPGISKNIKILHTDEILSYNFVKSDKGIWIKLYFNAKQPDMPPAMFVNFETPLHSRFDADITKLISTAQRVFP